MRAVEVACELARTFEGILDGDTHQPGLQPYRDPVGYWTIGYGHLLTLDRNVPCPDVTWGEGMVEVYLMSDMDQYVRGVQQIVGVPLAAPAMGALADFAFNLGLRQLRASTLLRLVNKGQLKEAADEFAKWKFAGGVILPGLVRRRAAERRIFLEAL